MIRAPEVPFLVPPKWLKLVILANFSHFRGTKKGIEIPIVVKKITDSGRSGPTTKTKSVPKSVNKMEQLETM